MNITELEAKSTMELRDIARHLDLPDYATLKRRDLLHRLHRAERPGQPSPPLASGLLEVMEDGFGFLRGKGLLPAPDDIYVPQATIRRFGLRTGDIISGQTRPRKENERYHGLSQVITINGADAGAARDRPAFETLTPIFPYEMFNLETTPSNLSGRLVNLVAPIGRGQRGLIVSPPKAGKTLLIKALANALEVNHPDAHLIIALIGERPEEVTDMRRSVKAEVVSSTFDEPVAAHIRIAELALERAKRLAEQGRDAVILLDSITRLSRVYNLAVQPSGRTLSGGIDPGALFPPKRFLGAARKFEEGGSLTIIATALVDTGSRMDDVIYEEFKGTGNMELVLNRRLAERRCFPAIDIALSSTRREELLLDETTLRSTTLMRRMYTALSDQRGAEAMEALLRQIAKTTSNSEFLATLNRGLSA